MFYATTRPRDDSIQLFSATPWGNRSLLFRDPDGNLINFFTLTSGEAR